MFISKRHPPSLPRAAWSLVLTLGLGGLAALQAGCGSDPVDDGDDEVDAFTRIYESPEFQKCGGCHAPGAAGRVAGIESTQNWSTRDSAYASLKGMASGMIGNFASCNGVPLLGTSAG